MIGASLPEEPARLEFLDVAVGYDGTDAISGLSFQVPHGARVAVVGPNGAGKSSLFKAMVGLLPVRRGSVLIHGLPFRAHSDCIAYLPQREEVDWRFPVTVHDVVLMGRYNRQRWPRRTTKEDRMQVRRCLALMGVESLAAKAIGELSGGQQQRVFIARALAHEPHILVMDEPFIGVDAATTEATLNLIESLEKEGVTVIVSTHDLGMAAARFELVMLLRRRLIAFGPPEEVLTAANLKEAFGGQAFSTGEVFAVDQCCGNEEHPS